MKKTISAMMLSRLEPAMMATVAKTNGPSRPANLELMS